MKDSFRNQSEKEDFIKIQLFEPQQTTRKYIKKSIQPLNFRKLPTAAFNQHSYQSHSIQNNSKSQFNFLPSHKTNQKIRKKSRKIIDLAFLDKISHFFQQYCENYEKGMKKGENSLTSFADQTGYGHSTIYSLYRKWLDDNSFAGMRKQMIAKHGPGGRKGLSKLSHLRSQALLEVLQQNPLLNSVEAATMVTSKFKECLRKDQNGVDVDLNCKSIMRLFYSEHLRSTKRNIPLDFQNRYHYCLTLQAILKKPSLIYYIDEMLINIFVCRDKIWGKPGKHVANVFERLRKQSFVIVGCMGEKGTVKYDVLMGNCTKIKYVEMLQRLLGKMAQSMKGVQSMKQRPQRILIINYSMGPVREIIRQFALTIGFKCLYLPEFSSLLNPLQHWFSEIRSRLKKELYNNDKQLLLATRRVLQQIKNILLPNYFVDVQKYFIKAIQKQNF